MNQLIRQFSIYIRSLLSVAVSYSRNLNMDHAPKSLSPSLFSKKLLWGTAQCDDTLTELSFSADKIQMCNLRSQEELELSFRSGTDDINRSGTLSFSTVLASHALLGVHHGVKLATPLIILGIQQKRMHTSKGEGKHRSTMRYGICPPRV